MTDETEGAQAPDNSDAESPQSDGALRTDGGETAARSPSAWDDLTGAKTRPTAPAGPTGSTTANPRTEDGEPSQSEGIRDSFDIDCARHLCGHRVLVESASGQRFEGVLERIDPDQRHVLLDEARELPAGTSYPRAFVAAVDWIVRSPRQD